MCERMDGPTGVSTGDKDCYGTVVDSDVADNVFLVPEDTDGHESLDGFDVNGVYIFGRGSPSRIV